MIQEKPFPLKAICVWCLIIAAGLITVYIDLISLTSVWVGFTCIDRSGSWVPILGGAFVFVIISFVFFRASKAILNRLNNEEVFNV